ncbi:FtsX-like permease family protein [Sphingobacterium chungjuense]|uniref:FtsX-like permease family protein n=1 Tax=Sphingobacterium chungjuense TaxID=2675553 RepID=UPI00140C4C0C|nr:FtsX-like permease family protein [Sphingobacterium chungjuense]
MQNYLKTAWRNIKRQKSFAAIHVLGMGVAIGVATLLFLTAMFELSFDDQHEDRDRIGLLYFQSNPAHGLTYSSTMPTPLAPILNAEIEGLEGVSRYYNSTLLFRNGDKQISSDAKFVDPDFLSIFDFGLEEGADNALKDLDHIAITKKLATSLFGVSTVVGQSVEVYLNGSWTSKIISAILQDLPKNSSLEFTSLIRFEHKPNYLNNLDQWNHNDHSVFVKTTLPINQKAAFNTKTRQVITNHFKPQTEELKRDGATADANGDYITLQALPFSDYHLNELGLGDAGSTTFPWMLIGIAGLMVFIACSNFINLSLANSITRKREVGTRKTLGSTNGQLITQFWTESLLITGAALIFGLVLAWLLLPQYNANMGYNLKIAELFSPTNLALFALTFLLIALIAGGYPAWQNAQSNVIEALKGTSSGSTKHGLRNTLTVVQFAIATFMIIGTIVISAQLSYLSNRSLGYNKTEVISIPIGSGINHQQALERMRADLATVPFVTHVTGTDINMGRGRDGSTSNSKIGFDYEGRGISTHFLRVDYDYLDALDIDLLAGRDFSRAFGTDTSAIIVNEQMAIALGGTDAILGKNIDMGITSTVIGVVKDFNFKDLRQKVEPLTMHINPNIGFDVEYIFVRVQTDNLATALKDVEKVWKNINPKAASEASYLDENTENMYKKDRRFAHIIVGGAVIAIVISCMGLFAIALLSINQRVKEIGIRKVLGSSISDLVLLLSKDFILLVLLALLIASPLAWWGMQHWLDGFAYRIDMAWWIFALAGIISLVIAILTVSGQAIRAGLRNPVNSLRNN